MKKLIQIFLSFILLVGQISYFQNAFAQTSPITSVGGAGSSGFVITKAVKTGQTNSSYQVTWQRTTQIDSDAAAGLLQSFTLYRSPDGTREKETAVVQNINNSYYYTYDENVPIDIQPIYRVTANYNSGQVLTTPVYNTASPDGSSSNSNTVNPVDSSSQGNTTSLPQYNPETGLVNYDAIKAVNNNDDNQTWDFIKNLFNSVVTPGKNSYNTSDVIESSAEFKEMLEQFKQSGMDLYGVNYTFDPEKTAADLYDTAQGKTFEELFKEVQAEQVKVNAEKLNLGFNVDYLPTETQQEIEPNLDEYTRNHEIAHDDDYSNSNSSGNNSSDNAADSSNFFLKNLEAINIVNTGSCTSGNTGILCVIEKVIMLGLSLAGLIAVAFIIYGGYLYITSAGNPEGAKAGISAVTNAAIGLAIILAAWIIVNTVLTFISGGTIGNG